MWPAAADIIYRMSVKKPCPLIRGKGGRVACRPLASRIVGARWVARRRVAGTRASLRQRRRASDAHTSRRAARTDKRTHTWYRQTVRGICARRRRRSMYIRIYIRADTTYARHIYIYHIYTSRMRAWCVAQAVSSRRRATCSLHTTLCAPSYASTAGTCDRITRSRAVHTTCCTPFKRSRARPLAHAHWYAHSPAPHYDNILIFTRTRSTHRPSHCDIRDVFIGKLLLY